jgi:hypothetical protein
MSNHDVKPVPAGRPGVNRLGIGVGLTIAAMVAAMYAAARAQNVWPAGHPFAGMVWLMVGYMTLRTSARGLRMPPFVYWTTLAVATIGCAIWAWATFGVGAN